MAKNHKKRNSKKGSGSDQKATVSNVTQDLQNQSLDSDLGAEGKIIESFKEHSEEVEKREMGSKTLFGYFFFYTFGFLWFPMVMIWSKILTNTKFKSLELDRPDNKAKDSKGYNTRTFHRQNSSNLTTSDEYRTHENEHRNKSGDRKTKHEVKQESSGPNQSDNGRGNKDDKNKRGNSPHIEKLDKESDKETPPRTTQDVRYKGKQNNKKHGRDKDDNNPNACSSKFLKTNEMKSKIDDEKQDKPDNSKKFEDKDNEVKSLAITSNLNAEAPAFQMGSEKPETVRRDSIPGNYPSAKGQTVQGSWNTENTYEPDNKSGKIVSNKLSNTANDSPNKGKTEWKGEILEGKRETPREVGKTGDAEPTSLDTAREADGQSVDNAMRMRRSSGDVGFTDAKIHSGLTGAAKKTRGQGKQSQRYYKQEDTRKNESERRHSPISYVDSSKRIDSTFKSLDADFEQQKPGKTHPRNTQNLTKLDSEPRKSDLYRPPKVSDGRPPFNTRNQRPREEKHANLYNNYTNDGRNSRNSFDRGRNTRKGGNFREPSPRERSFDSEESEIGSRGNDFKPRPGFQSVKSSSQGPSRGQNVKHELGDKRSQMDSGKQKFGDWKEASSTQNTSPERKYNYKGDSTSRCGDNFRTRNPEELLTESSESVDWASCTDLTQTSEAPDNAWEDKFQGGRSIKNKRDRHSDGQFEKRKTNDKRRSDNIVRMVQPDLDNCYALADKDTEFKEFENKSQNLNDNFVFKKVKEEQKDLFTCGKEYALAHCVAEDLSMGSGIAVEFKRNFKMVQELLDQRQHPGGLALLDIDGRYIYYLVTKRRSTGKPTRYTFWLSARKMRDHIREHGVEKLAIPRLGCGLDRLDWKDVKLMLEYLFKDVEVEILVCNFQQDEEVTTTTPSTATSATKSPRKFTRCKLVNVEYPISQIADGTLIIFFTSEDFEISEEMKSLDEKFGFLVRMRNARPRVGSVVREELRNFNYILYACVIKKTKDDLFSFKHFHSCLKEIAKFNNKDQFFYVGFQAVEDKDDEVFNLKIVNLMRDTLRQVDVYNCFPGDLKRIMPFTNREEPTGNIETK